MRGENSPRVVWNPTPVSDSADQRVKNSANLYSHHVYKCTMLTHCGQLVFLRWYIIQFVQTSSRVQPQKIHYCNRKNSYSDANLGKNSLVWLSPTAECLFLLILYFIALNHLHMQLKRRSSIKKSKNKNKEWTCRWHIKRWCFSDEKDKLATYQVLFPS